MSENNLIKRIIRESLKWDKETDQSFTNDDNFSNDTKWGEDENWRINPEKSYWVQGDGSSDVNEEMGDFDWVDDIEWSIPPTTVDELKNYIGWYFIADEKVPNGEWFKDNNKKPKIWEILKVEPSRYNSDNYLVYYHRVGDSTSTVNYKESEGFLGLIDSGRLVLVNSEGLALDPIHNRHFENS